MNKSCTPTPCSSATMAYGRSYRSSRRATSRRSFSRKRPYKARSFAATRIQRAVRSAKVRTFNKRVKRAIRSVTETKFKVFHVFGQNGTEIPGAGLNAPQANHDGLKISNILSHDFLNIEQGTGTAERIGNKISNCKLRLRGYVMSNTAAQSNNEIELPFYVHVLAYKKKSDPSGDNTELICTPGMNVGPVTYHMRDQLMPWNKAAYDIKVHRVFKLRPPPLQSGDTEAVYNSQTSNDPICRRFNIDLPIASALKYDNQSSQAGAQTPNNDWLCVSAYVTLGNGVDLSHIRSAATIYADATFRFTDS